MSKTQSLDTRPSKVIEFDCYRDQFYKILLQREPRLLRFSNPISIFWYFQHKIPETQAVDRFIEARIQDL